MIKTFITDLGSSSIELTRGMGRAFILLKRSLFGRPHKQLFSLFVDQIYQLGILSLPIILTSGLFIGMVLSLQGYYVLVDFAAEQSLGSMVALSLLRELGPVVAALLFAGRAGSALTAEIGLMQSTEQLASMEMMAVSPYKRVLAPRLLAGIVTLPMLTILFNIVAIWGGYLIGVEWMKVDGGEFWSVMQGSIDFMPDIFNGVIKSFIFATMIVWVAIYNGFYIVPTALGISIATTRTVVVSSLLVLGMDFILTSLMFGI